MWELDYKEGWALKNWCFWTVVLEKTLERTSQWIFIGRTDAETEAPILWPPDVKSWLIGKDPDAEKDWRQEEKRTTEDEMVGWHHWLDGHELEQALGDDEGQKILACCSPWGHKEWDTTDWLSNNSLALDWATLHIKGMPQAEPLTFSRVGSYQKPTSLPSQEGF